MSNLLTAEVTEKIKKSKRHTVIVTVGNSFRMDDGVGPYIFSKLESKGKLKIIDAGSTPENIAEEVIGLKPSLVLFLDAADFKGRPGEARVIDESQISESALSTHAVPMYIVSGLIKAETNAEVCYIGIQARNFGFGEGLSAEIKNTADEIVNEIIRVFL